MILPLLDSLVIIFQPTLLHQLSNLRHSLHQTATVLLRKVFVIGDNSQLIDLIGQGTEGQLVHMEQDLLVTTPQEQVKISLLLVILGPGNLSVLYRTAVYS